MSMVIFDAYLPLLAFASLLKDDRDLHSVPYDTVREDVDRLLAEAEQATISGAAYQPALVRDALFAACAFVDETLLTSAWQGREEWARRPLQRSLFDESNAGEQFYVRLRALLQKSSGLVLPECPPPAPLSIEYPSKSAPQTTGPKETAVLDGSDGPSGSGGLGGSNPAQEKDASFKEQVLAVYAACLTLGFTGLYHDQKQREELRRITMDCLSSSLAGRISLSETLITPEAYYMPEKAAGPQGNTWLPVVLWAVFPALVTVGIYYIYDAVLSSYAAEWLRILQ